MMEDLISQEEFEATYFIKPANNPLDLNNLLGLASGADGGRAKNTTPEQVLATWQANQATLEADKKVAALKDIQTAFLKPMDF